MACLLLFPFSEGGNQLFARIRGAILVAVIFILWTVSGCGGGGTSSSGGGGASSSGDGTPPPVGGTAVPSKTLSWVAPDSYIDSTPLNPLTDLTGFEIHVNETGTYTDADPPIAFVSAVDPVTHTSTTSFNLFNLSPSLPRGILYWVSVRAVSVSGGKSVFSYPVSFSF